MHPANCTALFSVFRLGWSTADSDLSGFVGFDSRSYSYADDNGYKTHSMYMQPYGQSYGKETASKVDDYAG